MHVALSLLDPGDLGRATDGMGELQRRTVSDDPTAGEDDDARGQGFRLGEVVRGEHDRHSLEIAEPVNEVMEIAARPGVEPGGRLVEEEERGTSDDGHRHIEASSLTSGEGLQLL